VQFLALVRELYPTARRVLLISWGDQSAPAPIVEAAALGQIDFYLPKPVWSPDEQFHRAITESLAEWWRQQGGQFVAVTVIGKEPSARVYEIRDLLTRNSVPFGFHRADSEEGSAALQRLGLDQSSGPVVMLTHRTALSERQLPIRDSSSKPPRTRRLRAPALAGALPGTVTNRRAASVFLVPCLPGPVTLTGAGPHRSTRTGPAETGSPQALWTQARARRHGRVPAKPRPAPPRGVAPSA
jgi:hypothetical protein